LYASCNGVTPIFTETYKKADADQWPWPLRGAQCALDQCGVVQSEPLAGRNYHVFKFCQYADRYLVEAQWRFDRRFDLTTLAPRMLLAAARVRPWPERAMRNVPVFSAEASC